MVNTPAAYLPGTSLSLAPDQIAHLRRRRWPSPRRWKRRRCSAASSPRRARSSASTPWCYSAWTPTARTSRSWPRTACPRGTPPASTPRPPRRPSARRSGKAHRRRRGSGPPPGRPAPLRQLRGTRRLPLGPGGPPGRPGRALGALALYAHERRAWHKDDTTLLSLFASHAAVALQNARLYERLNSARVGYLQALFQFVPPAGLVRAARAAAGGDPAAAGGVDGGEIRRRDADRARRVGGGGGEDPRPPASPRIRGPRQRARGHRPRSAPPQRQRTGVGVGARETCGPARWATCSWTSGSRLPQPRPQGICRSSACPSPRRATSRAASSSTSTGGVTSRSPR